MTPQSMTPQAITPQAITPQGMTPESITPRSHTPRALWDAAQGAASPPPALAAPLRALWWAAAGDWDRAHAEAQAGTDADSAWVHAWLHRQEGDLANAGDWYRRAGRPMPDVPLAEEWQAIAHALLAAAQPRGPAAAAAPDAG